MVRIVEQFWDGLEQWVRASTPEAPVDEPAPLGKSDVLERLRAAPSIFVGYSHSDKQTARQFVRQLRRARPGKGPATVFFDEDFAGPGQSISPAMVDEALLRADLFIILCGADTHISRAVNRELQMAQAAGIAVLPVSLSHKVIYPAGIDFSVQGITLDLLFPYRLRNRAIAGGAAAAIVVLALLLYSSQTTQGDYVRHAALAAQANYEFLNGDLASALAHAVDSLPGDKFSRAPEILNLSPVLMEMSYNAIIKEGVKLPKGAAGDPLSWSSSYGYLILDPDDHRTTYSLSVTCSGRSLCAPKSFVYSPDGGRLAVFEIDPTVDSGAASVVVIDRKMLARVRPGGGAIGEDGGSADQSPAQSLLMGKAVLTVDRRGQAVNIIDLTSDQGCPDYADTGSACHATSGAFVDNDILVIGLKNGAFVGFNAATGRIIWTRRLSSCVDDSVSAKAQTCTPMVMRADRGWAFAAVSNGMVVALDKDGRLIEPSNETTSPIGYFTNGTGLTYAYALSDYCEAEAIGLTEPPAPNNCWPRDLWIEGDVIGTLLHDNTEHVWRFDRAINNLETKSPDSKATIGVAEIIARALSLRSDSIDVLGVQRVRKGAFLIRWLVRGDSDEAIATLLVDGRSIGSIRVGSDAEATVTNFDGGRVILEVGGNRYLVDEDLLGKIWRLRHRDVLGSYSRWQPPVAVAGGRLRLDAKLRRIETVAPLPSE